MKIDLTAYEGLIFDMDGTLTDMTRYKIEFGFGFGSKS
jgi:phosphoserine phosphatase